MSTEQRRRPFPFDQFEPKWQRVWDERQTFHVLNPGEPGFDASKPKYYVLDMFPYPSGSGLHVGHPEGYTATDIIGRFKRMSGFNVLHPMGWDAFGLPAEQYAIKTGQHPRATTEANVATFKKQLQAIGFGYDWQREVNTTDPGYFKWTQWIFLQLYNSYLDPILKIARPMKYLEDALSEEPKLQHEWQESGWLLTLHDMFKGTDQSDLIERNRLAYISHAPVNWCPELGTVLSNEEVIDGKSEVGGHPVDRRPMRQWMLRITAYGQRLIDDLDGLDWPESIKMHQRNWIGRSEGATVMFTVEGSSEKFLVYTTRPDTIYGATYTVLAPEHFSIDVITTDEQRAVVREYREKAASKSDLERSELAKEKTGVFTGAFAINPVSGERIPIWVADYVLPSYGTGAIMAVPAHDERDWEFARKFALPIREVVSPEPRLGLGGGGVCDAEPLEVFCGEGFAIHSGPLDGLPTSEAKAEIIRRLQETGVGKSRIQFKLRDWLFSRQRYWGEPFPIVWENGKHRALDESELPLLPPELLDFKPTGTPEPPLSKATDWVRYSDTATRELNTMPQWAGSCWYYLRYIDPTNNERPFDRKAEQYWMGANIPPYPKDPAKVRSELHKMLEYCRARHSGERHRLALGYVDETAARAIREATGVDTRGMFHVLDTYAINHINKTHGAPIIEEPRGQIAVTDDDYEMIPSVLAAPDRIINAGKSHQGLDVLCFVKQVNGTIFVVEEVRAAKNTLSIVTMWKKKGTASDADIVACSSTSKTLRSPEVLTHFGKPVKLELESADMTAPEYRDSRKVGASPSPGVDLYVGGTEHAVLHLLYARFWHKVLFDLGHVSTPEPFQRLVNQGLILGEDGQKMSKSRGNVVNPDDVIKEYGADALRLYEMFMGPLEATKPWSMSGVEGVFRFLARVWRLVMEENAEGEWLPSTTLQDIPMDKATAKVVHATIKKVGEDIEALSFNTAISQMMVCTNALTSANPRSREAVRLLVTILGPFAPHLAEELWERTGGTGLAADQPWPGYDPALLIEDEIEMPVQVNGKIREKIVVKKDATQPEIEAIAKAAPKVAEAIAGKEIKKLIVVPGRLVNIVVG